MCGGNPSVRCRGGAADERGSGVGRAAGGQAGRGVEGCAIALSVVSRDSAGGYRISLRGPVPAAGTVRWSSLLFC